MTTGNELKKIIVNFSRLINLNLDDEASYDLAKISRGTPRIALRLLRRVRDYAQVVKKTNCISANLIKKSYSLFGLEKNLTIITHNQTINSGHTIDESSILNFLRKTS